MNNELKTRKLVNGEYWEVVPAGEKYLVVNTKQLKDQESGATNPETIDFFNSFEEAVEFLNNNN